jgi:hypothetical protein
MPVTGHHEHSQSHISRTESRELVYRAVGSGEQNHIGLVNLLLQMFALVVALFSLLFGRDVFWISAPVVAVVEPLGL